MLNLNKLQIVDTPEDITGYVVQRLEDLEIVVVQVPSPVINLEQANGNGKLILEVVSKMASDLDYAISSIMEYKPYVVFIHKVIKEPSGYKFRFQYIAKANENETDH
ncbi:hypothetical protein PP425_gp218 [Enterobacter phage vB_EclM_Q7622]|uniref:hypothetical protein n=1 Tax=Enterobacter phage vB_EclM_Q7622 TaxID=2908628 RepID=UPI0023295931|nr:hypothetical protein PP425_gp218 [Enterobacter phage vB_EclM_Q7622]UIS65749.1 hypothetical protein Q76222_00242 [Enterobacter phage vB_EclM_Q7622]